MNKKSLCRNIAPWVRFQLEQFSRDELINYTERAGIMEYDGGLSRYDAEIEAVKRIIKCRGQNETA